MMLTDPLYTAISSPSFENYYFWCIFVAGDQVMATWNYVISFHSCNFVSTAHPNMTTLDPIRDAVSGIVSVGSGVGYLGLGTLIFYVS